MAERLFGLETEYAFSVRGQPGVKVERGQALDQLMALARSRLPHLPSAQGSGIFLQNGARFYVDTGGHPELTTPEIGNPWDACRYLQAGEQILAQLAQALVATDERIAEAMFFRCNQDYAAGTTWACHESLLHRADLAVLPGQIIPFLVSRVIFTGAGGFDPFSTGLSFMISPRVAHLQEEISGSSTSNRGIFHTKDESLSSDGYHRLHLLCGESLCSETAIFLKLGTTALVVALIEAGLQPGRAVALHSPREAMRAFARDPACQARAALSSGGEITAIAIQRHYLEQAEAHVRDPFMPAWAEEVCRQWRAILEQLEQGAPASVATVLDWAMKYLLFQDRVARRGVNWESLAHWAPVIAGLNGALRQTPHKDQTVSVQFVLGQDSPIPDEVRRQTPFLRQHGLAWDQLKPFLDLRQELFEIDTRFGQIGAHSIFTALDRAGALRHHCPGVDNIEHAMANPPAIGRARLRAKYVKQWSGHNGRQACDWMGVWDYENTRYLDLSDPFATGDEKWLALPKEKRNNPASNFQDLIREHLSQVLELYRRGDYEHAHERLATLTGYRGRFELDVLSEFSRYNAWIASRRGFLYGVAWLNDLARLLPMDFTMITNYVCVYRFQGLTPPPAIAGWITKGQEVLAREPGAHDYDLVWFLGHQAFYLMQNGQPGAALAVLEQADMDDLRESAHPGALSRVFAERGEANRRLGNRREALRWLREARRLQRESRYDGELSDFTLTYRAKLETSRRRSLACLGRAKAIQTALRNQMGEARTLLLEARHCAAPDQAAPLKTRVLELRDQLPALGQCPLLAKVLERWDEWAGGHLEADEHGDIYWGV